MKISNELSRICKNYGCLISRFVLSDHWRAMEVHKVLGPGYLETVYQTALAHELNLRVIKYEREKHLPVVYKGIHVGHYIADFVVEEKIILELKSVTLLTKQHKAQAINYLVTTGFKLAILINFGERSLTYERIIHKAKL